VGLDGSRGPGGVPLRRLGIPRHRRQGTPDGPADPACLTGDRTLHTASINDRRNGSARPGPARHHSSPSLAGPQESRLRKDLGKSEEPARGPLLVREGPLALEHGEDLNLRPLNYESYDAYLCRLGQSPITRKDSSAPAAARARRRPSRPAKASLRRQAAGASPRSSGIRTQAAYPGMPLDIPI
jgi:hypothetical protein